MVNFNSKPLAPDVYLIAWTLHSPIVEECEECGAPTLELDLVGGICPDCRAAVDGEILQLLGAS